MLGIWPDTDESFNTDKEALTQYATKFQDQVYAVTVGSETLYRKNFTGEELLSKINDVKAILPNTKIGTADSWNKIADGTADAVIKGGVDMIMANGFSYWQGKQVGAKELRESAEYTYFDDMQQALARIQDVSETRFRYLIYGLELIRSRSPAHWTRSSSGMERRGGRPMVARTTRRPQPALSMHRHTTPKPCAECWTGASTSSCSRRSMSRGSRAPLVTMASRRTRHIGVS